MVGLGRAVVGLLGRVGGVLGRVGSVVGGVGGVEGVLGVIVGLLKREGKRKRSAASFFEVRAFRSFERIEEKLGKRIERTESFDSHPSKAHTVHQPRSVPDAVLLQLQRKLPQERRLPALVLLRLRTRRILRCDRIHPQQLVLQRQLRSRSLAERTATWRERRGSSCRSGNRKEEGRRRPRKVDEKQLLLLLPRRRRRLDLMEREGKDIEREMKVSEKREGKERQSSWPKEPREGGKERLETNRVELHDDVE